MALPFLKANILLRYLFFIIISILWCIVNTTCRVQRILALRYVTIHSRCKRIIFYYPSLAYAFADRFKILHRFFAEISWKHPKKKNRSRLATCRLSEGTNCFAVSMFDLCASTKTHTMQPNSCAFRGGTRESPPLSRCFLPRYVAWRYER